MPYDTYELSAYDGAPVELFLFRDDVAQQTWAFTTGDDKLVDGLVSYMPDVISRTAIKQSGGQVPDGIQIKVEASSNLAQQFKAYLPARPISLIVTRYQRKDAGMERVTMFAGQLTTVAFESDGMATLNCQPVTKSIRRKVPWQVYKSGCNWALYELGCGVSRTAFATPAGTYTMSGGTVTSNQFATKPDGWFAAGYVEVAATGERRFVTSHVGTNLTLNYPFTNLAPNEPLVAYAGCQRTKTMCAEKFNNLDNKLGFDFIPELNPYDTTFGTNNAGSTDQQTVLRGIIGAIKG